MSWSATRTVFGLVLATGALAAVLLGRGIAGEEAVADALRGVEGDGSESAAATAAKDSATPARPRRQIVPDVEVVVNIPSGRLELLQGDSLVRSYPVSVGSARYPTPRGSYLLATVIWNPWWNPPPESEWARERKPTPPGPGNPMGRVKLHMDELIYIHGTTSEGRLGAPASHGCIRMSNTDVVDLARRLHRIASPSMGDGELDAMSRAGTRERHTVLSRSVRMRVRYQTVELRGDRLHVFPDVYGTAGGFAAQANREMSRGGLDTALVPPAAMARLRQGAARGGASFALAEIPSLVPLPPLPRATARESGPPLLGEPAPLREVPRDTLVIGRAPEIAVPAPAVDDAPADPAPPPQP